MNPEDFKPGRPSRDDAIGLSMLHGIPHEERQAVLDLRGVDLLQKIDHLMTRYPSTANLLLRLEIARRRRHVMVDTKLVVGKVLGVRDAVSVVTQMALPDGSVIHGAERYSPYDMKGMWTPYIARRNAETLAGFLAEQLVEPIALQIRDSAAAQGIEIGGDA